MFYNDHRQPYRIAVLIFCLHCVLFSSVDHPHMIVRSSGFPELIEKSTHWPWSVMKQKAIEAARFKDFLPDESFDVLCYQTIPTIASSCALASILDNTNTRFYADRIKSQLLPAMEYLALQRAQHDGHSASVTPGHAVFMTYLALDVMYHILNPDVRQTLEEICDDLAEQHEPNWFASEYSVKGIKELYYNGTSDRFDSLKTLYKNYILDLTTEDGVYASGPGYAHNRLYLDNRIQKKIFMDICELQGYHEFYSHPKLINLYEWFFGYAVTPFNRSYTFGDSPPVKTIDRWDLSALRAGRFSRQAKAYASWFLGPLTDDDLQGDLLHYILFDSEPFTPERPGSRIFPNGGAWLMEESSSRDALAGVLWNIDTRLSSHTHPEANAIHIAAYGAHVLRNSGYDGWGNPDPVLWQWLHDTAEASNTVSINGSNHHSFRGGGITEWMMTPMLEYASGASGEAIQDGHHQRDLVLVHPQHHVTGYFLIHDQVTAGPGWGQDPVFNIALHPNSSQMPAIIKEKRHYLWSIQKCNPNDPSVYLGLYQVSTPDCTEIKTGYLGSYEECSRFMGRYLVSSYRPVDASRQRNFATLLIPYADWQHPLKIKPVNLANAEGALLSHSSDIADVILTSDNDSLVRHKGVQFQGRFAFYRSEDDWIQTCFFRQSRQFLINGMTGLESDSTFTAYMSGLEGWLISGGGQVTFIHPGISYVRINGKIAPPVDRTDRFITLSVDSGKVHFEISQIQTGINPTRHDQSDKPQLLQNFPNPFHRTTTIPFFMPFAGHVEMRLYNLKGQMIAKPVDKWVPRGVHHIRWSNDSLASGPVFCRLKSGLNKDTMVMIVQK